MLEAGLVLNVMTGNYLGREKETGEQKKTEEIKTILPESAVH